MKKLNYLFLFAVLFTLFCSGQKAVAQGVTLPYLEGFDEGIPSTWTIKDADGDGWCWLHGVPTSFQNTQHGNGMMASFSWSGGQPLKPDNWLISPIVTGATSVKYYVAVNTLYPNEHYAIMAQLEGQEDYIVAFEETLTGTRAQGPFFERMVNLPTGTQRVAFRHYQCTNQNFLHIDEILFMGNGAQHNPVMNLQASVADNGTDVLLQWKAPVSDETDFSYTVYRDAAKIAEGLTTTTYTDANMANKQHEYCVEVKYTSGVSPKACTKFVPQSAQTIAVQKPYTLTVTENTITVSCSGKATIYDMKGRQLASGTNKVVFTAQNNVYVVRIEIDGKTYAERISVK